MHNSRHRYHLHKSEEEVSDWSPSWTDLGMWAIGLKHIPCFPTPINTSSQSAGGRPADRLLQHCSYPLDSVTYKTHLVPHTHQTHHPLPGQPSPETTASPRGTSTICTNWKKKLPCEQPCPATAAVQALAIPVGRTGTGKIYTSWNKRHHRHRHNPQQL